jgi:hypothetical protein
MTLGVYMHAKSLLAVLAASLVATTALPAVAAPFFNRIASFPVALNTPDAEPGQESSSEIISATDDGMTLVYSNAVLGGVGFVDITDPKSPQPGGFVKLDGSPTSVQVIGGKALVSVDTTTDFTAPTGYLAIVDIATKTLDSTCDLGGQPDAVAKNNDATLIAISMENQRDEDTNDGEIPQLPGGNVTFLDVVGGIPDCTTLRVTDVAGLADVAPDDPEPEYTDFNSVSELALTLQENNHIVIIDGPTGEVKSHFSAGAVDLTGIDTEEDGKLDFTSSQEGRLREPDAIQWLDENRVVIANEGDYNGGSRSFSIFNKDGTLLFDSGNALDHLAAQLGHYPEGRSDSKGVEPEGMEVGVFGDDRLIFVNQERASLVAVYKDTGADPEYIQSLPSGVGPEGALAIPSRNLYVTANETDLSPDGLAGSHVMIFELSDAETPNYPTIMSDLNADGTPIGWVALSGLVADAATAGKLYAVNDSFLSIMPTIYEIDATQHPARITKSTPVTKDGATAENLDIEGITLDGEGGFWLANEGDSAKDRLHRLIHVNAAGEIVEEVPFPAELTAVETRSGSEGVSSIGTGADMVLWVAIQREWKDDEKGFVKLVSYKPSSGEWGAVRYKLEAPSEGGWVGLSEITINGDYVYLIERDNQVAGKAVLKTITRVPVSELVPAPLGGDLPVVTKELVRDLVPDLKSFGGFVLEKVEGFAIDAAGTGFVVTDNDGVDDSTGETDFWSIGAVN